MNDIRARLVGQICQYSPDVIIIIIRMLLVG